MCVCVCVCVCLRLCVVKRQGCYATFLLTRERCVWRRYACVSKFDLRFKRNARNVIRRSSSLCLLVFQSQVQTDCPTPAQPSYLSPPSLCLPCVIDTAVLRLFPPPPCPPPPLPHPGLSHRSGRAPLTAVGPRPCPGLGFRVVVVMICPW